MPRLNFKNSTGLSVESTNDSFILDFSDSALNVVKFGADPEGIKDSTQAITDCILAAANNCANVYFPSGTYKISTIYLTREMSNVRLFGPTAVSSYTSTLCAKLKGTSSGPMFTNYGTMHVDGIVFENLLFDGDVKADVGLYLDGTLNTKVINCWFHYFKANGAGIRGGGVLYPRIIGCTFDAATNGYAVDFQKIYASNSSTYYGSNGGWFLLNQVCSHYGFRASGDNHIDYNSFEINLNSPAMAALDFSDSLAGTSKATACHNYFELYQGTAVTMRAIYAQGGMASISVCQNSIFCTPATGIAVDLSNSYILSGIVEGNSIERWDTGIKYVLPNGAGSLHIGANFYYIVNTKVSGIYTIGTHSGLSLISSASVVADRFYFLNKAISGSSCRLSSTDITIDLSLSNQYITNNSSPVIITGVINAKAGGWFTITAHDGNTTLSNSTFHLACGTDYLMLPQQTLMFIVDDNGVVREVSSSI